MKHHYNDKESHYTVNKQTLMFKEHTFVSWEVIWGFILSRLNGRESIGYWLVSKTREENIKIDINMVDGFYTTSLANKCSTFVQNYYTKLSFLSESQ